MGAIDRRLLRRTRATRPFLVATTAAGCGAALLVLGQATLLARAIDRAFLQNASASALAGTALALGAVIGARALLSWLTSISGVRAADAVLSELRLDVLRRRLERDPAALDGADPAAITVAAVDGVDALEVYFARYLPQVVLAVIVPVAVLVWVVPLDLTSALIMAVTVPLIPVFMALVGWYSRDRAERRRTELERLAEHFADVVRGLPTLRAFGRAQAQSAAIRSVSDRHRRATLESLRIAFLSSLVLELCATLGTALVAVTVGVRLASGGIGFEAALTVLLLAPELYLPLRNVGAQYHASVDGQAVADRIFGLLDAPSAVEPSAPGAPAPPSPARGPVRFEAIGVRYPGRRLPALAGLELEIQPGEVVALVGPSGSGKTTAVRSLLRLVAPSEGRITVGGVDLAGCDTEAWRRQVAWVPQRPTLFHGTVAANIALGRPQATQAQIAAACAEAGCAGFIGELPDGYATLVGEGGRSLSSGQRRRLALARALVCEAPLVILDEPTADLDAESAAAVHAAVERLRGRASVLVVAHREALIELADRVVRIAPPLEAPA